MKRNTFCLKSILVLCLFIFSTTPAQDSLNINIVGSLYDNWGRAGGIKIEGHFAFVQTERTGIRILDISNPAIPVEIGKYNEPNLRLRYEVYDNNLYVAVNQGLNIVDVTDPANPRLIGSNDSLGYVYGIAFNGGYAYLTSGDASFRVLDVSNRTVLREIGRCELPFVSASVVIRDNYAYIAGGDSGVFVVDITDKMNPYIVSSCKIYCYQEYLGSAWSLEVRGDYIYIIDGMQTVIQDGLYILDISNPIEPVQVGFHNTEGRAYGLAVKDDYVYVADSKAGQYFPDEYVGLRIIEVLDPADPVEIVFLSTKDAFAVKVQGNYAYLADGANGLLVIDISDPSNPVEAGSFKTPSFTLDAAVKGNNAYIAAGFSGLRIVDVSNQTSPLEVGYSETEFYASQIEIYDNFGYVINRGYWPDYFEMTGQAGISMVDISEPENPVETYFIILFVVMNDNYSSQSATIIIPVFILLPVALFRWANGMKP
ncbi:MAG: hypothetical protein P9X24_09865 [Candidatus Hatepunaea meridiana]|nr:hypothetical protein [Candidatus Hatepunaea meridiana]